MYILILNFNLNFKFNLWFCHIYHLQYTFFMIFNLVFISKNFYISNQVKSIPIYLWNLKAISLYIRDFYYLVNILTFIEFIIRTIVLTKLYLSNLLSLLLPIRLKNNIFHNSINEQFARKLTIWIINSSISKNISFYINIFVEAIYHKLVVLLI